MKIIASNKGDSSTGIGPDQIVIELAGEVTDLDEREQVVLLRDVTRFASRWMDPLDDVRFENQCELCREVGEGRHTERCPEVAS